MREQSAIDPGLPRDALESRIVAALRREPQFEVHVGFEARVAERTGARPARTLSAGRVAGWMMAAVAVPVMVLVAPLTGVHPLPGLAVEFGFCAEFLGLTVWLGLTTRSLR